MRIKHKTKKTFSFLPAAQVNLLLRVQVYKMAENHISDSVNILCTELSIPFRSLRDANFQAAGKNGFHGLFWLLQFAFLRSKTTVFQTFESFVHTLGGDLDFCTRVRSASKNPNCLWKESFVYPDRKIRAEFFCSSDFFHSVSFFGFLPRCLSWIMYRHEAILSTFWGSTTTHMCTAAYIHTYIYTECK